MQVSKIFIGVNIATSLSLVLAGQAKAAGKGMTADFLKNSLNELTKKSTVKKNARKSATKSNPRAIAKFSSPKSVEVRKSFNLDSLNFKSASKLPSRQDLVLKEQKAQLASVPENKPLTGSASVKTYASSFYLSDDIKSKTSSVKAKRAHKRQSRRVASSNVKKAASVVTNKLSTGGNKPAIAQKNPVLPGQVGHPCASIHSMDARAISRNHQEKLTSPHLSNKEQVQLAKLARVLFLKDKLSARQSIHSPLDSNVSARQRVEMAYSKNGPPPFPLNLIPEPAMKDFLSKARNRKSMISSYPNAFASRSSQLKHSGFQGYSHKVRGGFGSYSSHALNYSHNYSRAPKSHIGHSGYSHVSHGVPLKHHKVHVTQNKNVVHKAHAKIATYGPYSSVPSSTSRGL